LEKREGVNNQDAQGEAYDIGLILAGNSEGRALRASHKFLYDRNQIKGLNRPFKKNGKASLITAPQTCDPFEGVNIRIVGPLQAEIDALQKEFDTYIQKKGLAAEVVLAAYADTRVPNLSSIVCVMEHGGKRILFTGDARGDKILNGLEQADQLLDGVLRIDVLKMPHHGSYRNVNPDFFEKIIAKDYIFSGNGDNGNPDRKTCEMLFAARVNDAYDLVLTYTVKEIDKKREAYAKSRHLPWSFSEDRWKRYLEPSGSEGTSSRSEKARRARSS
jgi:hypothetical protein